MSIRINRPSLFGKPAVLAVEPGPAPEKDVGQAFLKTFESIGQGSFWMLDASGLLTYLSSHAKPDLLGEGESMGCRFADLFEPVLRADGEASRTLQFALARKGKFDGVIGRRASARGERIWEISGEAVMNAQGEHQGYRGILKDVTEEHLNAEERAQLTRYDPLSNELNWDLGGPKLTAVSAWRRLYFRPANDGDGTPFSLFRNGFDVDVDQYSQEVRLASRTGGTFDWQVGTYYLHENLSSVLRQIFYSDAAKFVISAATPAAVLDGVEYARDGKLKVDSLAGFGQVTAHLSPTFSLTAGVRYTSELKRVTVTGRSSGGADLSASPVLLATRNGTLASFGGTAPAAAGAYVLPGRARRGSWSWLVNPAWQVTQNVLLYGVASYGEKSGAANTSASAAQAAVALTDPEKSFDFEAGIKTTWLGGKVIANLNVYNNTIKGYQDARIDPLNPGIGNFLANVGKVRLRGFEFEAAGELTDGVSAHFNVARNDAKYLAYADAPAPLEFQTALGGPTATLSLTGYQIRNAPKWTVQGGLNIERPVSDAVKLTAYGDVSWRSAAALINPRSIYGWQPAYALVNAGIGIKGADDGWSLVVWSKNLFDKRYAASFGAATALTPVIEILGDPRTFGATLSKRF